jgi:uncharacterized protein (TIGR01777 family)
LSGSVQRVAVTGASGLVGSRLTAVLEAAGCRVSRLVRREPATGHDEILFDPPTGRIDAGALEGVDAVVHLAGENVAAGRWTEARKRRIRESRVLGTRLIAESLAKLQRPPAVLVNASAIGFYGDRGDEVLDETSDPGEGFLPETCIAWESATAAAETAGVRVVRFRIGVVLAREGGALAKMVPIFRAGLGGKTGDGSQWMSWISIDDLVRAIEFALSCDEISGSVNAVGPQPETNAEFTRVLARVLRRPAIAPVPAFVVRAIFGEMGQELLLSSTRVLPRHLERVGFEFRHATLEAALHAVLDPT